jgi:hypothetical protein
MQLHTLQSPLDSFSMLSVLGWSSTPVKVVIKVKLPKKVGANL